MDTGKRLESLIGKHGLIKVAGNGEVGFTYLSVELPDDFPAETDPPAFHDVVSRCMFQIRFDDGVLVDGSNLMRVSGFYISRLEWPI